MEEKKSKNNNKENEGENEVKQRITMTRTEIKKAIRGYARAESVLHVEGNTNKQTVIREEHPSTFREAVENEQQASPLPEKDKKNDKKKKNGDGGGARKTKKDAIDKPEEKLEQKKSNELVQPQLATAMLKVHLPCDCIGCTKKIRKVVTKTIGYHRMNMDGINGQVTVKGSIMDMKALAESLKQQLNKDAEIVPLSPQKEDEKKEKSGDDQEEKDGGERKTGGEGDLDDEKTEKSSGVESMQGGVGDTHKPMLIGKVNPLSHRTTVEQNKYQKVYKVSPLPEKDEDKNNKKEKGSDKEENKKNEGKDKPKEKNSKEVLAESLKQQLNKDVEFVPPKNDSEKKEKSGSEVCVGEGKIGCESGSDGNKESEKKEKSSCEKERSGGDREAGGEGGGGGGSGGEKVEQYQYPFDSYALPSYSHAPQMFSDENPNSCSIM